MSNATKVGTFTVRVTAQAEITGAEPVEVGTFDVDVEMDDSGHIVNVGESIRRAAREWFTAQIEERR